MCSAHVKLAMSSDCDRANRGARGVVQPGRAGAGCDRHARSEAPEQEALLADSVGLALLVALTFRIANGKVTEIEVIGNPARLGEIDVSIVD